MAAPERRIAANKHDPTPAHATTYDQSYETFVLSLRTCKEREYLSYKLNVQSYSL